MIITNWDIELTEWLLGLPKVLDKRGRQAIKQEAQKVVHEAKTNHQYTSRTHRLENNTRLQSRRNWVRMYVDTKNIPYGRYVHQGWTRTRPILPKKRKALRFSSGGSFVFAKKVVKKAHYKGDPFLFRAWQKRQRMFFRKLDLEILKTLRGRRNIGRKD